MSHTHIFRIFVLLMLLAGLVTSLDARDRPQSQDKRIVDAELAKVNVALDDGRSDNWNRSGGSLSLGTANPAALNSRGALIAQTWRDWHANSTINRVVSSNPPSSGLPMVQFAFMTKQSALAANLTRWGFNAYEASSGSFLFPGGTTVVQSPVDADQEAGSYPKIHVDKNGLAIYGAYDFPSGTSGPTNMHIVWDDGMGAANFGDINSGSVMSETVRDQGSICSAETIWPSLAVSEFGASPVIYLCAYENGTGNCAVKVYRKVGRVAGNPDAGWVMVFSDQSFFPTTDIACDPTSSKVACTWTKADAGNVGDDVWMAESPTGLAGTWVKTNITNYTGAGYRAWLEATCMYDTGGKFHVIWNGGVSDGQTAGSRSCRLFHWSQWNPSNIYTIYSAEWDVSTTDCWGASNVMNVGKFSIAECDGRLYTVFCSWNDINLTGHVDDCCKSAPVNQAANGEYFVTISKDLQGKSWDFPRNLSNSYTPACDTGTCADDRWGGMSLYGTDDALFTGTETWPTAATYDPSGSYAGSKYVQFEYVTDRYPGGAVLATPQGPFTNNDIRWIRLACVQPITRAILAVSPGTVGYPEYAKPGVQKNLSLTLENTGNTTLTLNSVNIVYDSSKPVGLTNWLGVTGTPASIPEASTAPATMQLNKAGIVTGQPKQAWGRVQYTYSGGAAVNVVLTQPVELVVADTVVPTVWDTLHAPGYNDIVVGTNGNMGHNYAEGVNLDFFKHGSPYIDCDTGTNYLGNSEIYLGDASPVMVRRTGSVGNYTYSGAWSMFGNDYSTEHGWKPIADGEPRGHFAPPAPFQDGYRTGTFTSVDSTIDWTKTLSLFSGFWLGPLVVDVLYQVSRITNGKGASAQGFSGPTDASNLTIGEAFDWDVPSDSASNNSSGYDAARKMIWQRGQERTDSAECMNNDARWAATIFLGMHMKGTPACTEDRTLYGAYTAANDSFVYPANDFVPAQLYNNMAVAGYNVEPRNTDIHTVLTFKKDYSVPVNDTLTIYTAELSLLNGTLSDLQKVADSVFQLYKTKIRGCVCCCTQPTRGNVNQLGIIDLSDLSLLIAYLTAPVKPTLPCPAAANVNGIGIIDLSDLSLLIAYLTAPVKPTLPACGCP